MKEVILVDFDETLCLNTLSGLVSLDIFRDSTPNKELINILQKITNKYDIIIYTSRGQLSCGGDIDKIKEKYDKQIRDWLDRFKVPYKDIVYGKPHSMLIIDDKAITPDAFCRYFEN